MNQLTVNTGYYLLVNQDIMEQIRKIGLDIDLGVTGMNLDELPPGRHFIAHQH